jgi:uncharacterized membrane protein YjjP (DUF1212 family)
MGFGIFELADCQDFLGCFFSLWCQFYIRVIYGVSHRYLRFFFKFFSHFLSPNVWFKGEVFTSCKVV